MIWYLFARFICLCAEVKVDRMDFVAIRDLEIADFIEIILTDVISAEEIPGFIQNCILNK